VLGACEDDPVPGRSPAAAPVRVTERFPRDGSGWGPKWLNVRYEGPWSVSEGKGIVEVEPAVEKALQ
jgi:hypothetical protein